MILCCGEALIDMVPAITDAEEAGFVPKCGGAVFNTAVGLGRLGASVGMCTGLSSDDFGKLLADALKDSKVDTTHAVRSDRPTTLAFVHLTDGHASYSFFDENSAGRLIEEADLPSDLSGVDTLFFGGISLVSEPGADSYLALAKREAENKLVMLDPNIRPGFIKDEAAYRTRLNAMLSLSDIVKISDEDLDWLVPGDRSIEEKASQVLEMGPEVLLLTMGAEGVVAYRKDQDIVHQKAQPAKVVDTVGAGDSFNASFLAELQRLDSASKVAVQNLPTGTLQLCLEFATKVAAYNVQQKGANPPWRHELEAMFN